MLADRPGQGEGALGSPLMQSKSASNDYIPAFGHHRLTPLYDAVAQHLFPHLALKRRLVELADISPGLRVLDLGSGTGTLAIMVLRASPGTSVTGVDADPGILALAAAKARRESAQIDLTRCLVQALPFPDAGFDRVLSSLVIHHLDLAAKRLAAQEAYRVLRPGGRFVLLDLSPPTGRWARIVAPVVGRLEKTVDNLKGRLPGLLTEAGFADVETIDAGQSIVGSLACLVGHRSS